MGRSSLRIVHPHKFFYFCSYKCSWVLLALAFLITCSTWLTTHKYHHQLEDRSQFLTCLSGDCFITLFSGLFDQRNFQCGAGSVCHTFNNGGGVPKSWSVAGWVRLDTALDEVFDVTAFSIGPVSLKFAAPAVPYVGVESAWPDVRRQFEHKPGLRGHCADLTIRSYQTQSFDDALRECAQLPGCTVVTRNSHDLSTFFCLAAYSIDTPDGAWASAVLREAPPFHQYSGAVTVNSWNYFAMTHESGILRFYVNGFLRQTMEVSIPEDVTQLDLGRSPRWFESRFPGQIGNIRAWRRQLQPNEVVMSMSTELPTRDHVLNVTASPLWTGPPPIRPTWASLAVPSHVSECDAAVIVPVLERTPFPQLQTLATHLQHFAGHSCHAKVFMVACSRQDLGNSSLDNLQDAVLLRPNVSLRWDACVQYGLKLALAKAYTTPYTAVVAESLVPLYGWLSGLAHDLQLHTDTSAVFAKILFANGTIKSAGSRFEQAYDDYLGRQVLRPVEMYAGYPWNYQPTMKTMMIRGAGCSAWLMHSSDFRKILEDGFPSGLGSNLACSDMALKLQRGGRAVLLSPQGAFVDTAARIQHEDTAALQAFDEVWGADLASQHALGLAFNATVSWAMQCGGYEGIKAYNLMQHLEGQLQLRAQIQRGWPFCEHPDVLQGMPLAFTQRLYRLRRLSAYLPSDIIVHQKDYRQLAAWPWPPSNSSTYLIGRYGWDVDPIHRQWIDQVKNELDEVWVPSNWHAASLRQQGVRTGKIFVIPESVDSHFYDPDIWEPLTLPRQARLSFLSSFRLDDHAGWQAVLSAYLTAFRNCTDVSLYINTAMSPELSYKRASIYETMNTFLRSSNDTYLRSISMYPEPTRGAPHVYVFGRQLTQIELLRIISSVDVVVVPSRGDGWNSLYLEAMSLGKPLIATTSAGLAEHIQPGFAFQLNYTSTEVHGSDTWFRGARWAEPCAEGLIAAFRAAYSSKSLHAMGREARVRMVKEYDNEVVSNMVLKRLKEISEYQLSRPRTARSLDLAKDPVPTDVHICAMLPKASIRVHRTTPALKIAVVSTAPPRRCGIATFNTALLRYLRPLLPQGSSVEVFPLVGDMEAAPFGMDPTMHVIRQENYGDYIATARLINDGGFHAAILQHEFGIWGGTTGCLVVCFLKMLEVPAVTVIHTLSDNLGNSDQYILQQLSAASTAVVVMSESSRNKLGAFHGIPGNNVVVLPHGAPVISAVDPLAAKAMLNLTGRTVLLTHGLINPMKGVDLVLDALPTIVKEFPAVVYLVVGEPHPDCGWPCANYYEQLVKAVSDHRIMDHVRFVTEFINDQLLLQYVQAADIYVLPYKDRITTNSGTLTMALAAGKAIVSTPFDHAVSVLPGRGVLVDFESPTSLQEGILQLLRDDGLRVKYQQAARELSSGKDWRSFKRLPFFVYAYVSSENPPPLSLCSARCRYLVFHRRHDLLYMRHPPLLPPSPPLPAAEQQQEQKQLPRGPSASQLQLRPSVTGSLASRLGAVTMEIQQYGSTQVMPMDAVRNCFSKLLVPLARQHSGAEDCEPN
ncbi:hypothetical protein VOLCADRAFT_87398 [Volvox carteri f. nagariensis]|uniref:Glycosyl transferase family 1 domain-containing protein n=1 Tax=Volvox carteri f. nagariensis TaxID=3068 RepID=D8TL89_VOLCA|nr:uncharacterized protein VOLCADRAFT_87398 [Volvox carteri f. nagariensis]EFJ51695.1 hypothetical protein VOLCADRAFT_87398 [Volvox carteri f. nagariensis]|eukprot:XP_002947105.1 hypothetical protein VOLCADRAFT_87398 [Volvox carteri f. nagariensis]